jgi:alpha/beta superfamily hydrolase
MLPGSPPSSRECIIEQASQEGSMPEKLLDEVIEIVRFPAGSATLEGKLAYPEVAPPVGAAVLAGPHPLLGGSMDNNVLSHLGDGLARRGWATLRFNYGGAARMHINRLAEFWQSSHLAGEQDHARDLDAAIEFLRASLGSPLPLAAIGYSFGCSLLPLALAADSPGAFVLIAPAIGKHDLDGFTTLTQPKLVIAPFDDFALDEARLPAWFDRLPGPKLLIRPRLDGHFFRGHEAELLEMVAAFLAQVRRWNP